MSRTALDTERLAEEQAALRRVATFVASGASPTEVFEAVTEEVSPVLRQGAAPAAVFEAVSVEVPQLVGAAGSALTRFEADGSLTVLRGWTEDGYAYSGRRYAPEGTVSGLVASSGRAERIDDYADQPGKLQRTPCSRWSSRSARSSGGAARGLAAA